MPSAFLDTLGCPGHQHRTGRSNTELKLDPHTFWVASGNQARHSIVSEMAQSGLVVWMSP